MECNNNLIELTKEEIEDILSWAYRCDSEGFISESEWEIVRKLEDKIRS